MKFPIRKNKNGKERKSSNLKPHQYLNPDISWQDTKMFVRHEKITFNFALDTTLSCVFCIIYFCAAI